MKNLSEIFGHFLTMLTNLTYFNSCGVIFFMKDGWYIKVWFLNWNLDFVYNFTTFIIIQIKQLNIVILGWFSNIILILSKTFPWYYNSEHKFWAAKKSRHIWPQLALILMSLPGFCPCYFQKLKTAQQKLTCPPWGHSGCWDPSSWSLVFQVSLSKLLSLLLIPHLL